MTAERFPVLWNVLREQRRSILLWGLALAAVSAMYTAFWPSMGGDSGEMQSLIDNLPDALVTALGYDQIGTAGGYLTSTVYGLLGPALLLVFAISTGARLVAGQEEDGTLELELTSPVARRRVLLERLAALWIDIASLVAVIAAVTFLLVPVLDMDIGADRILAGVAGLLLLVVGFGTVALAAGAVTGRRGVALGVAAALAVLAFVLNAIGPAVDAGWMTAVSPFGWYLDHEPLLRGFDVGGLLLLAAVPVVATTVGLVRFDRRDLTV